MMHFASPPSPRMHFGIRVLIRSMAGDPLPPACLRPDTFALGGSVVARSALARTGASRRFTDGYYPDRHSVVPDAVIQAFVTLLGFARSSVVPNSRRVVD